MTLTKSRPAYLHLETGEILTGNHCGAEIEQDGELVFSTGMTGYVESLTDPSFAGQILTFTYPLIGNYGVPKRKMAEKHVMENWESERVWVQGVVMSEVCEQPSHFQSHTTFCQWMEQQRVPGIRGVDTRRLTQLIRDRGAIRAKIALSKKTVEWKTDVSLLPVPRVSYPRQIEYVPKKPCGLTVLLIDCGVKHGILRSLLHEGYQVIRVPWNVELDSVTAKYDAVVVSNGPGDPKWCETTVQTIRVLLDRGVPYLGICLGHQLLALALGGDTHKLPFGHRGLNQPCQDVRSGLAYLTSQNHGYVVDRSTLPKDVQEWFVNLNDGTNEGLIAEGKKIWSVQFHPEGCPGPLDTQWIFGVFKTL